LAARQDSAFAAKQQLLLSARGGTAARWVGRLKDCADAWRERVAGPEIVVVLIAVVLIALAHQSSLASADSTERTSAFGTMRERRTPRPRTGPECRSELHLGKRSAMKRTWSWLWRSRVDVPYAWTVMAGIAGLIIGWALAAIAGWEKFTSGVVTALVFQLLLDTVMWLRQRRSLH
jgi:hypothetical protein